MAEEQAAASRPLPVESFSYLVNFPSLESLEISRRISVDTCDDASSFIEMDPRLPPSKRFMIGRKESFKFDFLVSESLVDADELFCNGYVTPNFIDGFKMEESEPLDSTGMKLEAQARCTRSKSCRKYQRLSRRVLMRYLDFLRPLYRRLCGRRATSSKNGNVDTRKRVAARNRVFSEDTSPRISVAFTGDNWRRSCDSESSIYEAVLHCKKSFGK